jgi:hypothetical protein
MTDESNLPRCELCGEPMPEGETMFKFHGFSGPCPAPPLPRPAAINWHTSYERALARIAELEAALRDLLAADREQMTHGIDDDEYDEISRRAEAALKQEAA